MGFMKAEYKEKDRSGARERHRAAQADNSRRRCRRVTRRLQRQLDPQ
jgi:hypothetical protein